MARWKATITYAHGAQEHTEFEEFPELGEFIERGPDWNTIKRIRVSRVKPLRVKLGDATRKIADRLEHGLLPEQPLADAAAHLRKVADALDRRD